MHTLQTGISATSLPSKPLSSSASDHHAVDSRLAAANHYVFDDVENAMVDSLGTKMRIVGLFMVGIGLFFCCSVVVRWIQSQDIDISVAFLALLFMLVGIWTFSAGRDFLSAARDEGRDLPHLMSGLAHLTKLYTLLYMTFLAALLFAIIQLCAHAVYGTREVTPGLIRPSHTQGSTVTVTPPSTS